MYLLDRRRKSKAVIFAIVLTVVFYLYLQGQRLPFPVPQRIRICATEILCNSDFDVSLVEFPNRQVTNREDIPPDEIIANEDYDTVEFDGSRDYVDGRSKGELVDHTPQRSTGTQIGFNLLGDVPAKPSTMSKIDFGFEGDVVMSGSVVENGVSADSIRKRNKMKYLTQRIIPKDEAASNVGAVSTDSKNRKVIITEFDENVLKTRFKKNRVDAATTRLLKNTDAESRDAVAASSMFETGESSVKTRLNNFRDISRSLGTLMSAKMEKPKKSLPLEIENVASIAPGFETQVTGSGITMSNGVKPMFRFIIDVADVCDDHVTILIVVCSAVDNGRRRDLIRRTWASVKREQMRVLFLVGRPKDPKPSIDDYNLDGSGSQIRRESLKHGDLLQADFQDAYANLSLKSVAMLQWAAVNCRSLRFLVKADDDILVNTPLLLRDLQLTGHRRFVMGNVVAGARPVRDPTSKWFTPADLYPGSFYPKYVSGAAYVISGDLVGELYAAAVREKGQIFWIEDVFITGILMTASNGRGAANVQHIYNGKFDINKVIDDACALKRHLLRHLTDPESIVDLWSKITSQSVCFI